MSLLKTLFYHIIAFALLAVNHAAVAATSWREFDEPGQLQRELLLISVTVLVITVLFFILGKWQIKIDDKIVEQIKKEAHERYVVKMKMQQVLNRREANHGTKAPVDVQLNDELMRKKIERLRNAPKK